MTTMTTEATLKPMSRQAQSQETEPMSRQAQSQETEPMSRQAQSQEAQAGPLFARLDAYMNEKGLRSTTQRRVIAATFFGGPSHVTIEELLAQVRKCDSRIGYATVYRTLKLFTECGIAAERKFGSGPSRYELSDESNHEHHDHLICLGCGRIIEFHDERIEKLQATIAGELGFRVARHRHEIYGECAPCQELGQKQGQA